MNDDELKTIHNDLDKFYEFMNEEKKQVENTIKKLKEDNFDGTFIKIIVNVYDRNIMYFRTLVDIVERLVEYNERIKTS